MRDDFAVFILSNGRPDNIKTLRALKKGNYTGNWYIVCDDLDATLPEYKKKFKDRVIVFDKRAIAAKIDTGINDNEDMRAIVYARNACFDIAKNLGLTYFLELDDDYTSFDARYISKGKKEKLKVRKIKNLDNVFEAIIKFLDASGALSVAIAQAGDYIGGADGKFYKKGLARKCMNTFFCRTDNRFWWSGKQNEDVSTYTHLGNKGKLFFTYTKICIIQAATQQTTGGMTEVYLEKGGYNKPFSSVIFSPQAVKVAMMNTSHKRIHHKINWNLCTPKIINEKYKKVKK